MQFSWWDEEVADEFYCSSTSSPCSVGLFGAPGGKAVRHVHPQSVVVIFSSLPGYHTEDSNVIICLK